MVGSWRPRAALTLLVPLLAIASLSGTALTSRSTGPILVQKHKGLSQFLGIESLISVLIESLHEHHGHLRRIRTLPLPHARSPLTSGAALTTLTGPAVELGKQHLR